MAVIETFYRKKSIVEYTRIIPGSFKIAAQKTTTTRKKGMPMLQFVCDLIGVFSPDYALKQ